MKKKLEKNYFENCGAQIRKIVRTLHKILILLALAGGVIMVLAGLINDTPILSVCGIAMVVILPILIHVGSLFSYGYGILVENAERSIDNSYEVPVDIPTL